MNPEKRVRELAVEEFPVDLYRKTSSLLLYRSIWEHSVGVAWFDLVRVVSRSRLYWDSEERHVESICQVATAYGAWFEALAGEQRGWQDWLVGAIARADNPFTRAAASQSLAAIPAPLERAARIDLQHLQQIGRGGEALGSWVESLTGQPFVQWPFDEGRGSAIAKLLAQAENWGECLEPLVAHYHQQGVGLFGRYRAVRWQGGELVGVRRVDPVELATIYGCARQKAALCRNTAALVARRPALNVLLYGARGTGKSSLVKAMLNQYGDAGLRLVEVSRSDIRDLNVVIDRLADSPQSFIVFIDDLSFAEDETDFKQLKAMLEGDVAAQPDNVRLYATSNRRHLVKEHFDDRPNPTNREVHAWDTVQEKLSLSDRFGLTLTFTPFSQADYFAAVEHLARQFGLPEDAETLRREALKWAQQQNGFSGRTARQFVDCARGRVPGDVAVK